MEKKKRLNLTKSNGNKKLDNESQEGKTAKWGREQQSSFYASQPLFFLPQTVLQNSDGYFPDFEFTPDSPT